MVIRISSMQRHARGCVDVSLDEPVKCCRFLRQRRSRLRSVQETHVSDGARD